MQLSAVFFIVGETTMSDPNAIFVMIVPEARDYADGPVHFRWWIKTPGGEATPFREGTANLQAAATELLRAGWAPTTPVTYAVSVGVNEHKEIVITLAELAQANHRDLAGRPGKYIY